MVYRFGVFELDAEAQELRRSGSRVRLAGLPVRLLTHLVERRGEIVTREELRRALWSDGTLVDFEHGLNNAINKLRLALRDSPAAPIYIETLPRRGYRFIAALEDRAAPAPPPANGRWRWAVPAAIAVLVIAAVALTVQRQALSSRASAHEAYVRGREEIAADHPEAVTRARAYFERAIRLDRDFAAAHCGLAIALNRAGVFGITDPDLAHREAMAAANTALRLDPRLAEAYVARATARFRLSWDWEGADADLREAIRLDPNFVKPHQTWAQLLVARGRWREALHEIGTARQLDPLAVSLRRDEGVILFHARQFDAAISRLRGVVGSDPRDAAARRVLFEAYLHSRDTTAAKQEFLVWLELIGVNAAEIDRARLNLEHGGFPALWQRTASGSAKKGYSYKQATVLAVLGRPDEALAALDEAFASREAQLLWLKTDPYFDPLRADPRFQALLTRARM